MRKKILFGLMAVSMLTVGLLIWSCGDDDGVTPAQLKIELTAGPATISVAETATIKAKVNKNGSVQIGKEVSFEVTSKPTDSSASVDPATSVTDANGEATTTLSAGTKAGEIVVKGTVDSESAEVTVAVTAVPHIELTANPDNIKIDETATITARVTLEGSVQEGKEVLFEVISSPAGSAASVGPATSVTGTNGEATTTLNAGTVKGEVVEGERWTVRAPK